MWLQSLGAEVTGYALAPSTLPNLFDEANIGEGMKSIIGDVRDLSALQKVMQHARPEIVIHMAAQPLVRYSYLNPVETYATNVMGTIHVLEALRGLERPCAAVLVTTDKCYENRESDHRYVEEDRLGGRDPYSSSKAACEIAIASWRRSFLPVAFSPPQRRRTRRRMPPTRRTASARHPRARRSWRAASSYSKTRASRGLPIPARAA